MKDQELQVSVLLIASGVFSGISHLFGFQKRSSRHHECANQLSKIIREIDLELSKKKSMRLPADLMLQRVYHEYSSITDLAPDARSVALKTRKLPINNPRNEE